MKTRMACLAGIVCLCSMCLGVTLQLRSGKKLSGEVVTKDFEQIVLQTPGGIVTQAWRQCTPATIKALHPALYQRLVKEAQERKKQQEEEMTAKGLVNVGGTWVSKTELVHKQLARVRLFVQTEQTKEPFREVAKTAALRIQERDCKGLLTIKLEGLDPAVTHTLKTVFSHYALDIEEEETVTDTNVTKTERISNEHTYQVRYETTAFKQYKGRLRAGWHATSSAHKRTVGAESAGWDVSVWLDDVLVFEQKKDGTPQYHHVQKW